MSLWQRCTQLVHRFTCRQERIQVSMQTSMHIHHAVDLTISGTILGCIKPPYFWILPLSTCWPHRPRQAPGPAEEACALGCVPHLYPNLEEFDWSRGPIGSDLSRERLSQARHLHEVWLLVPLCMLKQTTTGPLQAIAITLKIA